MRRRCCDAGSQVAAIWRCNRHLFGTSKPVLEAVIPKQKEVVRKEASRTTTTLAVEHEGATIESTGGGAEALAQPQEPAPAPSILGTFVAELEAQTESKNRELNQFIPMPDDPTTVVPEFRRVMKHARHVIVVDDPATPRFQRRDNFVTLPEPEMHPWIPTQPIGPNIVHGDGHLGIVGTGEVGFDEKIDEAPLPQDYRGLQHTSIVGSKLPQRNGFAHQDLQVKHSFKLTGRGIFAQKKIAKGTILMVVGSTAQHTGIEGEVKRLGLMVVDLLKSIALSGTEDDLDFLHLTVLTGQMSSVVERWPVSATNQVIEMIGGEATLHKLQIHALHIARIAAVIDMNSFLIESTYAERHGSGYWPEAGYFNHSCSPNSSYEIIPQHTFPESDFYLDMLSDAERKKLIESRQSIPGQAEELQPQLKRSQQPGSPGAAISPSRTVVVDELQSQLEARRAGWMATDLTSSGTPQMLFCMRAERDLEPGEEVLISYVPSDWSFNARQIALQHRYKFWCRCERCAPSIDKSYAMLPNFSVFLIVFVVLLQFIAHASRSSQMRSDDDILLDDQGFMPEPNDRGKSGAWRRPGESVLNALETTRWDRAMNGENADAARATNKVRYAGDPYSIVKF